MVSRRNVGWLSLTALFLLLGGCLSKESLLDISSGIDFSTRGLSVNTATVNSAGVATVTVSANFVASKDITFRFKTVDGTAVAGSEYVAVDRVFTLKAGYVFTVVPVVAHEAAVDGKSFKVLISDPSDTAINREEASVTIVKDSYPIAQRPATPAALSGQVVSDLQIGAAPGLVFHGCAKLNSNELKCWGDNAFHQLGIGSTTASATLVSPAAIVGVVPSLFAVSAKGTCAMGSFASSLDLRCWGDNSDGVIGNGGVGAFADPFDNPVGMTGLGANPLSVAIGTEHACAVMSDGSVKCWGKSNTNGKNGSCVDTTQPQTVAGISGAVQVAVGAEHSCAVAGAGEIYCWGLNDFGQLGDGNYSRGCNQTPVKAMTHATQVVTGAVHSCGLSDSGTVKCWGSNVEGQLGFDSSIGSTVPVSVGDLTSIVEIAAGENHACARTDEGSVYCWGDDTYFQTGAERTDVTNVLIETPTLLPRVPLGATSLRAQGNFTCVVLSGGIPLCWGDNG